MIDATTFAHAYTAFWREHAPTCEHFVRRLNLDGLERFDVPLAKSDSTRRALIAEFGFSLFVERAAIVEGGRVSPTETAWTRTENRLAPFADQGLDLTSSLEDVEKQESEQIANRLDDFFANYDVVVPRPLFFGCGFIDSSEADVIADDVLFEVKTVERPFRSVDVRQALTYCALNFMSAQFELSAFGLVNPRTGLWMSLELDEVCVEISGKNSANFFMELAHEFSSGDMSR